MDEGSTDRTSFTWNRLGQSASSRGSTLTSYGLLATPYYKRSRKQADDITLLGEGETVRSTTETLRRRELSHESLGVSVPLW